MKKQRGAVLLIVMITAVVCAIASYAILEVAMAQSHQTRFWRRRTQARYLAEAAIVKARESLWNTIWANPTWPGGTLTVQVDSDGNSTFIPVNVVVSAPDANGRRTMSARVIN